MNSIAPNLRYTPSLNYLGTDSFTFKVNDGALDNAVATVSITVRVANNAPVAMADTASTGENKAVSINVLGNDTDVNGDTLGIASVTQGAHGSAAIAGTSVIYTPAANFIGTDTFTYTVSDGNGGASTASVMVTVNAVNNAPVAYDDAAIVETRANPDSIVIDDLRGTLAVNPSSSPDNSFSITTAVGQVIDLDYLSIQEAGYGYSGIVSRMDVKSDGQGRTIVINGTPLNFSTVPSFTVAGGLSVHIWKENGQGSWLVEFSGNRISISPAPEGASGLQGASVVIAVLSNDTDIENDVLSIASVTEPQNGTVTINDEGTVTYKAKPGFTGSDSFEYAVSDGNGGTGNATVAVGVVSQNAGALAAAFDSVTGDLNIGSSFTMRTVAGDIVNLDTLSLEGAAYSYSGTASEVRIRVREQGRTIAVNGITVVLKTDLTYVFTGDVMSILANRNPDAVQTGWWISISGQNVSISLEP